MRVFNPLLRILLLMEENLEAMMYMKGRFDALAESNSLENVLLHSAVALLGCNAEMGRTPYKAPGWMGTWEFYQLQKIHMVQFKDGGYVLTDMGEAFFKKIKNDDHVMPGSVLIGEKFSGRMIYESAKKYLESSDS
jgi:hypothetical protein